MNVQNVYFVHAHIYFVKLIYQTLYLLLYLMLYLLSTCFSICFPTCFPTCSLSAPYLRGATVPKFKPGTNPTMANPTDFGVWSLNLGQGPTQCRSKTQPVAQRIPICSLSAFISTVLSISFLSASVSAP